MSRRPSSNASFEAADSECRPLIPAQKCGSVAEAVAIAVIKEHVATLIAGNGAARSSRRVTPLPSHTVVLESAPPSLQETKPSLPAFSQGLAAKPQGLGSCRHTAWFSETSHCSPIGSDEKSLPPAFEKWSSELTDDSLPLILESHGQQHPPSLRSWRSVSDDGLLRTLERDRRLDTWLKRHGLSLPNVKLALQTCVAMLLICVWMAIPPVYGVQQPPWSNPGWAGITVILLLEPTEGATLAKTVLRVAGTVLGACLSALLLWALHASYSDVTDAVLLCGVLPPFCALCAYCKARCKPYAYLWTVCSLTPTIVVLFSYDVPEQQTCVPWTCWDL